MISSIGSYLVNILFTFITQAVLIRMLGIEYSGINGLFTNIITMLSVAELGIGTTIIYKLYDPIAKNDKETIKSWMAFYKKCYLYVAFSITIVGLLLIPFVPVIVGTANIKEGIIFLYLISLLDSILSYVMTYKRSLLYADQRSYIINIIHICYVIAMNVSQIIILLLTKDYIIFLLVKLIYRILENIIINIYVNKKYPYILEKYNSISNVDRKDIFERIRAIFLQKISFVVNKGIDNIIISLFLGVSAVGYYNNYNLVVLALCSLIFQLVSSMSASVGNLLTENNKQKNYDVYCKLNMLNSFLSGFVIVGFISCIDAFVKIWLGEKYVLSLLIVVSFGLYIYSDSIRRSITMFKEAAGICKEDKYMYIVMTLINLISSIILCKICGISGVILGTALSYLFLILYSYPKFIFKPIFNKKIQTYYINNLKYFIVILVSCIISFSLTNISFNNKIFNLLFYGLSSIIIYILLFIGVFRKTTELRFYNNYIKRIIKRRRIITK